MRECEQEKRKKGTMIEKGILYIEIRNIEEVGAMNRGAELRVYCHYSENHDDMHDTTLASSELGT